MGTAQLESLVSLRPGFAVLLGFVVFLAFESFDTSRSGAETEAQIVRQQFETAQLLPVAVRSPAFRRARLLRAYGDPQRVAAECRRAPSGTASIPWSFAMFRITKGIEPRSAARSRRLTRSGSTSAATARPRAADRTHGAEGVIPLPLWIVLFLSAVIIFVFMLFFADSHERALVQATMMGGIAIVITSTLLLLWFLDHPYHSGPGSLRPVAMERTIRILDQEAAIIKARLTIPCDEQGTQRAG